MEEKSVRVQDWRNLDYMWRDWKVKQIRADVLMWMGRVGEAAVEMHAALEDINSDNDREEAHREGFFSDLSFLQKILKNRFGEKNK